MIKEQEDRMKCPKCGRFALKEGEAGITCSVCGYSLTPGQADKFRLFKLLREEEKKESGRRPA